MKPFLFFCLLSLALSQTFTSSQTNFVISNFPYSNGGLNTAFAVGPAAVNIFGLTVTSFNIGLVPGVNTIILLANGLLMNDLSLLPLGGFSYNYSVSGLPSWATYYAQTKHISATPPMSFSNVQFSLTYSDSRSNINTIAVIFSQSTGYSLSSLNFVVNNTVNSIANTYTIVFPLFTTTSNSLSSIRSNAVGALTNIGTRPWTNVIPVTWSSAYINYTTPQPSVVTNASGTYYNGVLISNSGYFTNSTGTYYNGIFVGTGFTTNSTGTYYNQIYVGEPGYVLTANGLYKAGVLVSTITTGIPVSATATSLNGFSGTGVAVNSINTSLNSGSVVNTAYTSSSAAPFVVNSGGGTTTTSFGGVNGVTGTASGSTLVPGSIVNPQGSSSSSQYIYDAFGNILGYSNGSSVTTTTTSTSNTNTNANSNLQYLYSSTGSIIGLNPNYIAPSVVTGTVVPQTGQVVSNTGVPVISTTTTTSTYNTGSTSNSPGAIVVPGGTITQTN